MKRCPQCGRDYNDPTLSFCLDDGAALLDGPANSEEHATAILPEAASTSESPTRTFDTPPVSDSGSGSPTASGDVSGNVSKRSMRSLAAIAGSVAIVALAAAAIYWLYFSGPEGRIESIAVMPFVNESGDADVEYLSDGMTETLISSLSKLPNLDVKPRSSVFRYKGKETDPKTIAGELNVQGILNGRVTQRGQDISLFVELIDVALDKVVWSQQYSRQQSDLVDLQAEIARDVSSRLKPKISDAEETKVTKTYTANSEAYQLYLKGNFYLSKYTEDGARKGIEYFEQALALDPNYALAHHGIANAYDFANGFYMRPREAEPKAKAAAMKALEIDDTLAQTHFLLGKILFWYDWDFPAAERHWKRANELDPSYPPSYPLYLAAIRKYDEAIRMQEALLRRTPLDLNMNMDMAGILLAAGKVDQAIEQNKKALELDHDSWWANQQLGLAYIQKGQTQVAVGTMEKARSQEVNSATLGYLGYAYGKIGRKEDAERVIEELKELSGKRYISPMGFVLAYAGIGDRDKAFDWLDRAFEEREPMLTLLTFDGALESLNADPRFSEFLDRMNLPK